MAILHQAHAGPSPHEAILLFTGRTAHSETQLGRTGASTASLATEVVSRETLVVAEICDPCHFLPRWWKAPEFLE